MLSGLRIRSPYIDWIRVGTKTWEIRTPSGRFVGQHENIHLKDCRTAGSAVERPR
jgi:hypothetical protein